MEDPSHSVPTPVDDDESSTDGDEEECNDDDEQLSFWCLTPKGE